MTELKQFYLDPQEDAANTIQQNGANAIVASGALQSKNYAKDQSGYSLDELGNVEFNNATIRGTLAATLGEVGGFDIGADYIRDAADSMGIASTVTGGDDVRFWAGDTFANRAAADFNVTESGAVTAANITITGGAVPATVLTGTVALSNTNIAAQGWTQTCAFSVTDADTVAWGAGTFTTAAGTSYSISSGNTGNMAAKTYIYLDINVSTTVYQTTTTATTAIGIGKVLVAIAQNGTGEATFTVLNNNSQNIDAGSIVANSITANELSTSITYAGTIVVDTAGAIRSGQTAFNTGTGWFIGTPSGTPKLSIGNPSGDNLLWTGTAVEATDIKTINTFTCSEDLTAGDAVAIGDGVSYIEESDTTPASSVVFRDNAWYSQSFTTSEGALTIASVTGKFVAAASPGNMDATVAIYSDNAGKPNASLGSKVISPSVTTGGGTVVTVTFDSPISVSPSTTYHIVWQRTVADNSYSIFKNSTASVGTNTSADSGGSWSAATGKLYFEVYEIDTVSGQICKTQANINRARSNNFIGFAYETISSGNACRVNAANVVTGLSGLTAGTQYYLSDTAGSLASSAGTVSRKVGIGLTSTSLLIRHDNN